MDGEEFASTKKEPVVVGNFHCISFDYNSAWHQVAPGGSHSSLASDDGT